MYMVNSEGGLLIKDVVNFDGGKGLRQKIGKNGLICYVVALTEIVPDKFGPKEI